MERRPGRSRRLVHPPGLSRLAIVGLVVATLVVVVVAYIATRPGPEPATGTAGGPSFTYAGTWTMADLVRAIDAGEVAAVTVPAPGPARVPGSGAVVGLAARTSAGETMAVATGVTTAEAVDSLRSLGYGRLLTVEALDARNQTAAPSPTDALPGLAVVLGLGVIGILVAIVAVRRLRRGAGAGAPAGALEKAELPDVRLADVAGVDEAKLELTESIEFLRDPARFAAVGAKPVRGVMLYGPPGTGKTMLAKAVASEAGVPFFAASGSDFVEKFVGVGASRIRALFASARKAGSGVIFIDEIDAIGKVRGGASSHEEREQTLNQLLVELDGFGPNENIVVIAATNRLDTLDPALVRPGRFTRKVNVPLPDREDRRAILAVHAAGKPLGATVDLEAVARKTYGFSGAMLADLLNESAIMAAREGRWVIEPGDVQRGWLKVAVGTSRQRSMDDRERSIIAAHEAGHAVCGHLKGDKRRVEEISLYQHGEALGVTVSSSEDNDLPSERDMRARLVALMGGRVAEELLFRDVTGGASNDLEKATNVASSMVTRLGMGRDPSDDDAGATGRGILSAFVVTDRVRASGEVAAAQDRAVRDILDTAYRQAREVLLANMDLLQRTAGYLFEHERMSGDDFEAVLAGTLGPADPFGWRAESASPRPWEEIPALFAREPRIELLGPAGAATPARNRRRSGTRNRVRRALPRPVHLALQTLERRRSAAGS